jgi:hypothetical protein
MAISALISSHPKNKKKDCGALLNMPVSKAGHKYSFISA